MGTAVETDTPKLRWGMVTDAPLAGLALAREAGRILAWDEAGSLYLLAITGQRLVRRHVPQPIQCATMSDDGGLAVVVGKQGDVWLLDSMLEPHARWAGAKEPLGVAADALGQYLAISSADRQTVFHNRFGVRVGRLESYRPLRHLAFLPVPGLLVGAGDQDLLGCWNLYGRSRWLDSLLCSVGGLAATEDGRLMFVACYTHGIQRYSFEGINEGSYQLTGPAARVATTIDGKYLLTSLLDGGLLLLDRNGHVLWEQQLGKPVVDLAIDALGRYVVYGLPTGEMSLLDLEADEGHSLFTGAASAAGATAWARPESRLREPDWKLGVAHDPEQALTAVLALSDDPPLVYFFSNRKQLEVFDQAGRHLHRSEKVTGLGRIVRAAGGIGVAATDRRVLVYVAGTGESRALEYRFVELTHLVIDAERGGLLVVEEGDRLSRVTLDERVLWTAAFDSRIVDLAVGPGGYVAATTDNGRLAVFDPAGGQTGEFQAKPAEPLALAWMDEQLLTLAHQSQIVRGHSAKGLVDWSDRLAAETWRWVALGGVAVAQGSKGKLFIVEASGKIREGAGSPPAEAVFVTSPGLGPGYVYCQPGNLIRADLNGRVLWRHLTEQRVGPIAGGASGVACMLGVQLAFFSPNGQGGGSSVRTDSQV